MMWPLAASRGSLIALAVTCAFAAGSGISWAWQANRIATAAAEHQAETESIRAAYAQAQAMGEAAARQAMENANNESRKAAVSYQAELDNLRAAAARRPARLVRVCEPGPVPASAGTGDRATDGAGGSADATTDGRGMGPAAGASARTVDLSGLDSLILDEAKAVSARLRALQGLCGG